ncbi:MAG: hypothetical protein AAGC77_13820 [Pseudomonadota bacterium]
MAPEAALDRLPGLAGLAIVLVVMGVIAAAVMTSSRLKGSSLFNRLFVIVAMAAGFFSAVSSAMGFGLITSQESDDFFRNSILPPAFGVFVFFLAVAIWVGGAELVRHRDWFRGIGKGPLGDALFFLERAVKLLVVIPAMAVILFFVSTWTTVVGVGGVDAVRHTYDYEIERLQADCAGITAYRQKDYLFAQDLSLAVSDVLRVAEGERTGGAQSGAAGAGAVVSYYAAIADWLRSLERSVTDIIESPLLGDSDSPYDPEVCANTSAALKELLSRNAFENYDLWAREFQTEFNEFTGTLNRWRHDKRIEQLLEQQSDAFARANPKPMGARISNAQSNAIDRYAEDVEAALGSLLRSQKATKPPPPQKSAAELSPARGLQIFVDWVEPPEPIAEPERISRAQAVVDAEFVAPLSTISPRDAVLKHANIFSDIWALAISWDYAAYVLMFAFLFFPSAERAAGFKDE